MPTSEPWPYPSYSDRQWLGGERGPDVALAAVVRVVRAVIKEMGGTPGTDPDSLAQILGLLVEIDERVSWALLSVVGEARCAGMSWQAIGTAMGVTKQAAQQRFAPYVKEALERASAPEDPPSST